MTNLLRAARLWVVTLGHLRGKPLPLSPTLHNTTGSSQIPQYSIRWGIPRF